jgi:hypothetical protein
MPRVKELRGDCPECAERAAARMSGLKPTGIMFDEHGRAWDAARLCATLEELVNAQVIAPEDCNRSIRDMQVFAPRAEGLDLLLEDELVASRLRSCLIRA